MSLGVAGVFLMVTACSSSAKAFKLILGESRALHVTAILPHDTQTLKKKLPSKHPTTKKYDYLLLAWKCREIRSIGHSWIDWYEIWVIRICAVCSTPYLQMSACVFSIHNSHETFDIPNNVKTHSIDMHFH